MLQRLSLTLKTLVLPSMPWLFGSDQGQSSDSQKIIGQVSEAAEAVTQASRPLSELCALIGTPHSIAAGGEKLKEKASIAEAGRDAWLFSNLEEGSELDKSGGEGGRGGYDLPTIARSITRSMFRSLSKGTAAGNGGSDKIQASREAFESSLSSAIDQHLGPEATRVKSNLQLMECELKLLCQTSSAHSRTISKLIKSLAEGIKEVRCSERDGEPGGEGQLIEAAGALRDISSSLARLDQGLNESALKDLVEELRAHRSILSQAPDVMERVSLAQADLQGRMARMISSLSPSFKEAMGVIDKRRQQERAKHPAATAILGKSAAGTDRGLQAKGWQ